MPFFSIIIPTYNSEAYIARCCLSIIDQTCNDFEIIIQDGISSDGTKAEIDKIMLANPSVQLKVFTEKDQGVFDAMNKAIIRSSGEWLLFLGSDDELYDRNVLMNCLKQLQNVKEKMVYGNVMLTDKPAWANDSIIYDGPFTVNKLFAKNICHQAIFYNRSIFNEIGFFNTRYCICADWEFNLRCFAKTGVRYIDVIVARFTGGGLSSTTSDTFRSESIFILKDYFKISHFNKLFETYSWVFFNHAEIAYRRGSIKKALYYFLLSFKHAKSKMLLGKTLLRKLIRS